MPSGSSASRLKKFFRREGRTESDESNKQDFSHEQRAILTPVLMVEGDAANNTTTSKDSLQSQPPQTPTTGNSALGATSRLQQLLDPAPPSPPHTTADTAATNDTANSLLERLWDRAYDDLKTTDPALTRAYEKILSRKLRDPGLSSPVNESEQNIIAQDNVRIRRDQMRGLIHNGLEKTAREAGVKDNISVAMQVLNSVKGLISSTVQAVPQAALPWTGVCIALDILANPLTETEANRSGIEYVIKRMGWYWNLSSVLLRENLVVGNDLSGVRNEIESQIIDLYEELLSYQMKSVCSYYRNRGLVFLRDIVKLDGWDGKIDAIRKAEDSFRNDSSIYTNQKMTSYLEQLVSRAADQVNIQMTGKDEQCLKDLRVTDAHNDKKRIEDTKGGLLRDSYRWVLDNREWQQWRNDEQSRLLWIKGDPGKGKTMLLCGIVDELNKPADHSYLLSYFFCQATDSRINSAAAVLQGLIYLLVSQQPALISHVRTKYDQAGNQLFKDANAWYALSDILADILRDPALETIYLIIDALDECVFDLSKLLKLIVEYVPASPRVKWIVSSRGWPSIEQQLALADCAAGTKLSLEVNAEVVAHAVDSYIAYKVSQLISIKSNRLLQDRVREVMSKKANGTFLWAALVFKELQDRDDEARENDEDILKIIDEVPSDLTELYSRMLQQVDRLRGDEPKFCLTILAIASVAYQPLRLLELPIVAGFKGNLAKIPYLERLVSKCGSFLTCRDSVVYFVHQSAKDYLTRTEKALAAIFPNGIADVHHSVFSRSLKAINDPSILKQNIYALTHSGTKTDEVNTPEPDPLAPVRYSCVYWINHLLAYNPAYNATNDLEEYESIDQFLRQRYLYWLEALGWIGKISDGIHAISALELFVSRRDCSGLSSFLHDAKRFVLYSRPAIEQAPLQIYSSALIFAPRLSITRETFKIYIPEWVRVLPKVEEKWNALLQTLEGHSHSVTTVAFSPDGKTLASASRDQTVKLWDAGSGTVLQTLKGHSYSVTAVAFSPDGKTLASASRDQTVKLWDAGSGAVLQTLEGHSGSVHTVAFSPDGKTLASASRDQTVKLWDAGSGAVLQTLEGHSNWVYTVAFSPDGETLASASRDQTVKLWDAGSGAVLQTLDVYNYIYDLSFSGDGTYLQTERGILPILSPPSTELSVAHQRSYPAIFIKDQWIYSQSRPVLWLPPEYRTDCVAVHKNTAGFGYGSGRVIVIELDI